MQIFQFIFEFDQKWFLVIKTFKMAFHLNKSIELCYCFFLLLFYYWINHLTNDHHQKIPIENVIVNGGGLSNFERIQFHYWKMCSIREKREKERIIASQMQSISVSIISNGIQYWQLFFVYSICCNSAYEKTHHQDTTIEF